MILQYILRLHHLLICSQELEHIHKTQQRSRDRICNKSREAVQARESDEDAKQEPEYLLDVEEDVGDLLFAVVTLTGEGAGQEIAFVTHSWIIFDYWKDDAWDKHVSIGKGILGKINEDTDEMENGWKYEKWIRFV